MLENIELLVGIGGGILGIIAVILVWRKNLLNSGFESFKEMYREEMDTFKKDVRGYINKNDEKNTSNMARIVQLFEQTKEQVATQTGICRVIQARREGSTKADDMWRKRIEEELTEVQNDVKHIKKVINHSDYEKDN